MRTFKRTNLRVRPRTERRDGSGDATVENLQLEDGSNFLLEDGSSFLLLE